ncbi:DUF4136 domain-containing protein [Undibacterium flavidum]|uniref:DUF4136 domain-containing protein n=1 Tax=Undibacterium flavidum TaxID=2762297 RepID=A0ABR6YGH3_9BURK|nr:hypothetical protein [Undibacterium flavidum]MBC3875613.1 hypothetical protein [Undibacterium flavidum]
MKTLNKRVFLLSLILCAAALTGCASTFSSKINTVNQLPATFADKSYTFVEHPEQGKEPEYQHASEDLKLRLKELGFNETDAGQATKAALKLSLQLISVPGNTHVSSPFGSLNYIVTPSGMVIPIGGFDPYRIYPGFIRAPYRFYPRSVFYPRYFGPLYSPFGFGRRYDPFYGTNLDVRQYFDHGVEITITEAATGKLLYSVTAKTTQNEVEIDAYLGLLIESALRDFPNKSGETRVDIQVEK